MKKYKLRLTHDQYIEINKHLFPGDGNEAIAFALCGFYESDTEEIFTINKVELYPHDKCTIRLPDRVEWSPPDIIPLFESCRKNNLRLIKIHCHPGYWPEFSQIDNKSDIELSDTLTGWINRDEDIMSLIMLPDGHLFGRVIDANKEFKTLETVIVIGDDIKIYEPINNVEEPIPIFLNEDNNTQIRTEQAFGEGTVNKLKNLKIGVVGCSGTGSIVAELLGRLGVREIVLVDDDKVEFKNLNRIINSKKSDAISNNYKVSVLKRAIEDFGTNVLVTAIPKSLFEYEAYHNIASCDVVFGCMDKIDGRHLLNRISTFFCSAYFDVGVRLDANGIGGINDIIGRVDYVKPGGSSLLSREKYTIKQLIAADLARTDPMEYKRQVSEKYIKEVNVDSPAVISINMMFSSQAVTELLARIHPFRDKANVYYSSVVFSISGFLLTNDKYEEPDVELLNKVGKATTHPYLDSPILIRK